MVLPEEKPLRASKGALSTLNSPTMLAGGTCATLPLVPPVLAAPSTLNSWVPLSLPLMASAEAFSLSNGRTVPSDRLATPGARMASTMGLPSLIGSSWKSSAPMVIPEEGSVRLTSGVRATTTMLSLAGPS